MDGNQNERLRREDAIDSHSIEWAIEEYADRLYAVALRITGSPEDAEDAIQEAFIAALQARESFRGTASVATWLHRIAVNAALTCVRRRETTEYLSDDGMLEINIRDWSIDLEADAERNELRATIHEGLKRIEPDIRAAVVLRDVESFSAGEAAQILEITESALKSRLHRGRLLLRRYLADALSER
ncbi:MAG: RNA polymerase sigma factor [Chloroflexota bacterium]